jgi:DNA repair protein RAD16
VQANRVIFCDFWWNPAVEAQAIDRAHRIGQTKRVVVYRLVIENTIEQRILDIQEKKMQIVDAAFGGKEGKTSKLGVADLATLFGL